MRNVVCCRGSRIATATAILCIFVSLSGLPAARAAEIKIGLVNPATGPFSVLGQYARKGIDLALDEAKKSAVLKDVTFKVIERDSGGKPADAIRYSRELLERENVDVELGGLSSAECLALQKFAAEEKIVYITASGCWVDDFNSNENVNDYAFRPTLNSIQRNYAFADWLVKNAGKRWYIAYSDYAYGQSGRKAFEAAVKDAGGEVAGSIGIPFGTADMAGYFGKIDRSADGLYFVFAGRDAILALGEAFAQGLQKHMKFAGMQSLVTAENFPKLPSAAEGLAFIGDYPRDSNGPIDTPANKAFRAAYFAKYPGDVVGLNAFEAYQATNVLLKGIELSGFRGRNDTEKLSAALSGLKVAAGIEFPAGPLTIRAADHQGVAPLYIAQIKGGHEAVLDEIPADKVAAIK
jgi:branched-chain amino acid transport system substrate-binding protein